MAKRWTLFRRRRNDEPAETAILTASNGDAWKSVADYRSAAARALSDLETVQDHGPLRPGEFPLALCVRNEAVLISPFLRYYRKLGVTRFLVIDTGSSDGTLDILKQADDVDLWHTRSSFAKANSGRLWIDGLLHARAHDRWILHVDTDEFLVFPEMEHGLSHLVGQLDRLGEDRLHAPMLDMYSERPIRDTVIGDGDPLQICNWFDGEKEVVETRDVGLWTTGGPRKRLFFANTDHAPGLTKFPLIRYGDDTAYIAFHTPTPFDRNYGPVRGRLLHVKLHAGFAARAQWAVREGQYWRRAWEYQLGLESLSAQPGLTAFSPISRCYTGPDSLIDAGLMSEPGKRHSNEGALD